LWVWPWAHVRQHRLTSILSCLAIALASFLILSFSGFVSRYQSAVEQEVDGLGYDMLITARGCPYEAATLMLRGGVGLRYMPSGSLRSIQSDKDIASVFPTLIHPVRDPASDSGMLLFRGVAVESFTARSLVFEQGEAFESGEVGVVLGHEIAELEQFIRDNDLLTLDDSKPLEIRETPEYQRGVSGASLQSPGPLESNLPTFYNVSPIPEDWTDEQAESFLEEYNTISMKILSIHEALPGHYVQLYYANRHPSLVRASFGSGVMIEGWAHYTEDMMVNAGLGGGDPRYSLVEKKWKLRGISNAIIDQKIHAERMTEQEALDLMINETFQEESEANGKWRRAQLTSAQLSTYFTGYILFLELLDDYKAQERENFTLKKFHEELLSYGSIPIRYIREMMIDD